MKNLSKCQEKIIIQQETYYIYWITKIIKNSLVWIYPDKLLASIPQKNNFTAKLEENDGATMFFVAEKQEETIWSSSLDSLIIVIE